MECVRCLQKGLTMRKKKSESENMIETKPIIKEKDPKDAAVEELIKRGYNAYLDRGVVLCEAINEDTFKEIADIFNKIGYNCSYGVIGGSPTSQKEDNENISEQVSNGRPEDERLAKLREQGVTIYSISRLDTINNCLQSAYKTYILHEKGKNNIYAYLGSNLHQTLEDITNGKATEADLLPSMKEELSNMDALGIAFPTNEDGESRIRDNWVKNIEHFCKTYKAPVGKKLTTESLFIYHTPNNNWLQGYIDLYRTRDDGSIDIFDYKSSSMYKGDDLKTHARQLILYALGKEQEGIAVRSASWIFLKYCTVKFMGKKRKNSKEKSEIVKYIERRKLGQELKSYIYDDMIEAGFSDFDAEIALDKINETNILKGAIPDEIANKYIIRPCVISVDLSQESKDECIKYIDETIEWDHSINGHFQEVRAW